MMIGSISSKFDYLHILISGMFEILIIMGTKLYDIYGISRIHIDGYSMLYRHDRGRNDRGVVIFVRHDIPSKVRRKVE